MPDPIAINNDVVKGGKDWINFAWRRGKYGLEGKFGLEVHIKADPEVESFIASISTPTQQPLEAFGRSWMPLSPDSVPLNVYTLAAPFRHRTVNLEGVCGPLIDVEGTGQTNLSFLRIAGISGPDGIRFVVQGPVSKTEFYKISQDTVAACRELIRDYITPVELFVSLQS